MGLQRHSRIPPCQTLVWQRTDTGLQNLEKLIRENKLMKIFFIRFQPSKVGIFGTHVEGNQAGAHWHVGIVDMQGEGY